MTAEQGSHHQEAPRENFLQGFYQAEMPPYMGEVIRGKNRDNWSFQTRYGEKFRVQVTTDRISALNEIIGTVPGVGAILNRSSEFWAKKTEHIVPNAILDIPHDNIAILEEAERVDIEVIVREYLSRSGSKTSVWKAYSQGERTIYDYEFPDGLVANQRLPMGPIVTPTTKGDDDLPLGKSEARELVDRKHGDGFYEGKIVPVALALFQVGQEEFNRQGLIILDTKYEFGIVNGVLKVIDEIHTSSSSRIRMAEGYNEKVAMGIEPAGYDKEPARDWLLENGYVEGGPIPILTDQIRNHIKTTYEEGYTILTGQPVPNQDVSVALIRQIASQAIRRLA